MGNNKKGQTLKRPRKTPFSLLSPAHLQVSLLHRPGVPFTRSLQTSSPAVFPSAGPCCSLFSCPLAWALLGPQPPQAPTCSRVEHLLPPRPCCSLLRPSPFSLVLPPRCFLPLNMFPHGATILARGSSCVLRRVHCRAGWTWPCLTHGSPRSLLTEPPPADTLTTAAKTWPWKSGGGFSSSVNSDNPNTGKSDILFWETWAVCFFSYTLMFFLIHVLSSSVSGKERKGWTSAIVQTQPFLLD